MFFSFAIYWFIESRVLSMRKLKFCSHFLIKYFKIVESHCYIQVQRLAEMGFPESSVKATLEMVGGDENMALEKLCSG